ncbi:MAG: hypothetical protein PUB12_01565 [[Clostridium] aminophilum]|uniref:hypothetical protein n=1 Tax=[Clostridium] aminophilum TaxID=1526 RepID=UPI0026E95585|nr:hypothetical protein [[Clostridium] aminophilum]MDD6195570.1 hypothetical protein [[Clostridium] aminophilum]
MEITTESERLTDYRKNMLKLILSNHNQDCMSCPANGTCELQKLCNEYGVERAEHKREPREDRKEASASGRQSVYQL